MDQDLILEFTKEMFTMKQFEQVCGGHLAHVTGQFSYWLPTFLHVFTYASASRKDIERTCNNDIILCIPFFWCSPPSQSYFPPPSPQFFLPSLLHFTEGLISSGDSVSRSSALEVLVSLILAKAPPPTDGSMAFEKYPLVFTGQPPTEPAQPGHGTADRLAVPETVLSLLPQDRDQPISDLSLPWSALVLLPHLRPLTPCQVISAVTTLLNRLLEEVESGALGKGGHSHLITLLMIIYYYEIASFF